MKIREGYILRNVAGSFVVVPVGEATLEFNGMMNLNETGAFLFEKMIDGISREDLIKDLTDEYDVDEKTASEDVDAFITKVEEQDLFEE